jgi:putative two-component system response regulator
MFDSNVCHKIMVIDDTPANLDVLSDILQGAGFQVVLFPRASSALRTIGKDPPDMILLDIIMPEMDGFDLCAKLKANAATAEIPVIFLSALNETTNKVKAFSIGGVDYITKPFQQEEVLARVRTHLSIGQMRQKLETYSHQLEKLVQEKVKEISDSQLATLQAISSLAEFRDEDTGQHTERTRIYCKLIASQLRNSGLFTDIIDNDFIDNIYHAAPLHDIGKIGIPDRILLKPGPLDSDEFEIMKRHVTLGVQTLKSVLDRYPRNTFIKMGMELTGTHHEKWNGSGYPGKLKGGVIPLSGRIMALADVYDALRSVRPYKKSFTHELCSTIIRECSGQHFDPIIVEAFIALESQFAEIGDRLRG